MCIKQSPKNEDLNRNSGPSIIPLRSPNKRLQNRAKNCCPKWKKPSSTPRTNRYNRLDPKNRKVCNIPRDFMVRKTQRLPHFLKVRFRLIRIRWFVVRLATSSRAFACSLSRALARSVSQSTCSKYKRLSAC